MTYNPNIPQATDIISQSQPLILTNFSQLNTVFMVDHVEYDNATAGDRGKHTSSTYVEQAVAPATGAAEEALYSAAIGGTTRIFVRPPSSGAAYQLTATPPSAGATGYSYLPGGILIQWGTFTWAGANVTQIQNFPISFSTAYQVVGTTNAPGRDFSVTAIAANNFTASIVNPAAGIVIRWIGIGAE